MSTHTDSILINLRAYTKTQPAELKKTSNLYPGQKDSSASYTVGSKINRPNTKLQKITKLRKTLKETQWNKTLFKHLIRDCFWPIVYITFRSADIRHSVSKSVKNRINIKVFGLQFFREKRPRHFYGRLLAQFTVYRLTQFGWISFAGVRLQSLTMKWNAEFTEGGWKLTTNLKPFVDQSSCRFDKMYRRSLLDAKALARLFISCFLPNI